MVYLVVVREADGRTHLDGQYAGNERLVDLVDDRRRSGFDAGRGGRRLYEHHRAGDGVAVGSDHAARNELIGRVHRCQGQRQKNQQGGSEWIRIHHALECQ